MGISAALMLFTIEAWWRFSREGRDGGDTYWTIYMAGKIFSNIRHLFQTIITYIKGLLPNSGIQANLGPGPGPGLEVSQSNRKQDPEREWEKKNVESLDVSQRV